MHHINSLAYFRADNLFVLGDKRGNIALVEPSNLDAVFETNVGNTTIQAIGVCEAHRLVVTLNKDFSVTILRLSDGKLDVIASINGLEHMVEDGYQVAFSESQEIAGTTAETVIFIDSGGIDRCDVGAAVRDLAFIGTDGVLACLEDGKLIEIQWRHPMSSRTVFRSAGEPIWSLAINPDNKTIAVGERMGRIVILNRDESGSMEEVISTSSRIPKRMKWLNREILLVVHSSAIDRISYIEGKWSHEENFYNGQSNTVEDFLILENGRFLVGITYNKLILVWDVATGELLSSSYWDFDYAKGMLLEKNSKNEFYVYGRDMVMKKFCLHDAQVNCLKIFEKTNS